ncbi:MAG: LysM peptidoglycan-binding domain-containing protein [Victivallaceae bacterium]|nr:LysM peptidoglycan-binding domain-containing protein [Victivallaceae bacterium]
MKSLIHIFAIAILFLGLTGCGLKNGDESSHPLFKRAVKAQKSNEIQQAVKYFNRYLALRPDSSKTHLMLASIYDENLDRPLRAVYHYERFLEFAPGSPEAGNVKKWLNAARKKYYYKARLKYNDPEDVGALQNTLYTTEQELKKIKLLQKQLIKYGRKIRTNEKILNAKLIHLRDTHRQTLEEMEKIRNKLKETLDKKEDKEKKVKPAEAPIAEKEEEKKIVKPEEKSKPADSEPIIPKAQVTAPPFAIKEVEKAEDEAKEKIDPESRTYTVKKGDSLSSISRQFYGSSKYYKLIFDANSKIITSEKSLQPGQVLKIPVR